MGPLQEIRCAVPTAKGLIQIEIKRGEDLRLLLTVPQSTTAKVGLAHRFAGKTVREILVNGEAREGIVGEDERCRLVLPEGEWSVVASV